MPTWKPDPEEAARLLRKLDLGREELTDYYTQNRDVINRYKDLIDKVLEEEDEFNTYMGWSG